MKASGGTVGNWAAGLGMAILLAGNWCLGVGYEVDPVEYQQALDKVVEANCQEFARRGVDIDPARLSAADAEIVDSFLNGRDFYRVPSGSRRPMAPKLEWLQSLLGEAYGPLEAAWRQQVEDRAAGRIPPLSREEIAARLDALEAADPFPVCMDDGSCRSSCCTLAIDVECIHCGRHVLYRQLDETYHNLTPAQYRDIARDISQWGIPVEVDARAACPDCSGNPDEFQLADFPVVCHLKPEALDADEELSGCWLLRKVGVGTNWDLPVVSIWTDRDGTNPRYELRIVLPEAWLRVQNGWYDVHEKPGGAPFLGIMDDSFLTYAEPREEVVGEDGMTYRKVLNVEYASERNIPGKFLDIVRTERSTGRSDIPSPTFIIDGRRVEVDVAHVEALRSFAQGYKTIICGPFSDHSPLKSFVPWLRETLLGP
ncbi:MAG: hypothetical protein IJT88_05755 [Kiritimatiellae bacterium]|nr:hypothetical protein [Kiritimatiellia bacterium]